MEKSGNDRRENGNDPSEIRFQVADREGMGMTDTFLSKVALF